MYNKFRGLNPKELLKHDWLKQGRKRKKKKKLIKTIPLFL
jgi:hypothetical protein